MEAETVILDVETPATTMLAPVWGKYTPVIAVDQMRNVEKLYLNGDRFNLAQITTECRALIAQEMLTIVELGKRFCAVKEMIGHGSFLSWMEESEMPVGKRMVQQYMAVGHAVAQRPELRTIGMLGIYKATYILTLPEESLDELADKGTIDGKPLDQYMTMTRNQLITQVQVLTKQLTETKEDYTKLSEINLQSTKEVDDWQKKYAQLAAPKSKTEVDKMVLSRMDESLDLLEDKADWLESVDLASLSTNAAFRMKAFAQWCLFRFELLDLRIQSRLADLQMGEAPTPKDWERNEERVPAFRDAFQSKAEPPKQPKKGGGR